MSAVHINISVAMIQTMYDAIRVVDEMISNANAVQQEDNFAVSKITFLLRNNNIIILSRV